MKLNYEKLELNVQYFTPNEYIGACGDSGVSSYYFKCDAPGGKLYYYENSDGAIDGKYNGNESASYIGKYNPCSAKHKAPTTSNYYDGFVDYNDNGTFDEGEGVIVWRGWLGLNGHATKNLDMDTWETDKS